MQRHETWLAMLAIIVSVLGQYLFFATELYNAPKADGGKLVRQELLTSTIASPPHNFFLSGLERIGITNLGGWQFMQQRADEYMIAFGTILGATIVGWVIQRHLIEMMVLNRGERIVISYGLGMGLLSLFVLLLGLAGQLSRTVFLAFFLGCLGCAILVHLLLRSNRHENLQEQLDEHRLLHELEYGPILHDASYRISFFNKGLFLLLGLPFVLAMMLGAGLPTTDFDCLAYHLLGPKEWYEARKIIPLPHNVYTFMPFFSEMFHLFGMTICKNVLKEHSSDRF